MDTPTCDVRRDAAVWNEQTTKREMFFKQLSPFVVHFLQKKRKISVSYTTLNLGVQIINHKQDPGSLNHISFTPENRQANNTLRESLEQQSLNIPPRKVCKKGIHWIRFDGWTNYTTHGHTVLLCNFFLQYLWVNSQITCSAFRPQNQFRDYSGLVQHTLSADTLWQPAR